MFCHKRYLESFYGAMSYSKNKENKQPQIQGSSITRLLAVFNNLHVLICTYVKIQTKTITLKCFQDNIYIFIIINFVCYETDQYSVKNRIFN